jgi:cyclopropane fatty-acyl-phospholipid synthase-like methyltransferase
MDPALPPTGMSRLSFHGPLGNTRADRIIERLARANPRTILDLGCGWGELILRLLAKIPSATGIGIDLDENDLARGTENAEVRGVSKRIKFIRESATTGHCGPADLVLCVGASHALSEDRPPEHIGTALKALRNMVTAEGQILFGDGIWERPPSSVELNAMWPDTRADELPTLTELVNLATQSGFRPAWIETANQDEWDEFESGYQLDQEEWLQSHPDHPMADDTRTKLDQHRSYWLNGYRGVMGFAYLTLLPVAT